MRRIAITAFVGAACLGIAACSDRETNTVENSAAPAGEMNLGGAEAGGEATTDGTSGGTSAATAWSREARIVEENGVTYRINADGTRVRLGENESRIVVENGVRYRVDPDGTRVRINREGLNIDLPDVDVGINKKGNLDVDVNEGDRNDNRSR